MFLKGSPTTATAVQYPAASDGMESITGSFREGAERGLWELCRDDQKGEQAIRNEGSRSSDSNAGTIRLAHKAK